MPKGDRQIAALPWRHDLSTGAIEVLLVTTLETRRWVIPKGWPMPGRKDHHAAAEEAREEAGVSGVSSPRRVGSFSYDKRKRTGATRVTVDVYPLRVLREHSTWPEMAVRRREWMSPEIAATRVLEPELRALLLDLKL